MTKIEQFLIAAKDGLTNTVLELISKGKVKITDTLNKPSAEPKLSGIPVGTTALMLAAGAGHLELVKTINAQINPKHLAHKNAAEQNVFDFILNSSSTDIDALDAIATLLLNKAKSAELNLANINKLLTQAIEKNLYTFLYNLIISGAPYKDDNLLVTAIQHNRQDIINLLTSELDGADKENMPLLQHHLTVAIKTGNIELVRFLCAKNLKVTKQHVNIAIQTANAEVIRYLLINIPGEVQANFNRLEIIISVLNRRQQILDGNAMSVSIAKEEDHANAMELLRAWFPGPIPAEVERKIQIDDTSSEEDYDDELDSSSDDESSCDEYYIKERNAKFDPILFAAAASGANETLINTLITQYHCSVDAKNKDDQTPLDLALANNGPNAVVALLNAGAKLTDLTAEHLNANTFTFRYANDRFITASLFAFAALNANIELLNALLAVEQGYTPEIKKQQLMCVVGPRETVADLLNAKSRQEQSNIQEILDRLSALDLLTITTQEPQAIVRESSIPALQETQTLEVESKESSAKPKTILERISALMNIFGGCMKSADQMPISSSKSGSTPVMSSTSATTTANVNSGETKAFKKFADMHVEVKNILGERDIMESASPLTPYFNSSTDSSRLGSRNNSEESANHHFKVLQDLQKSSKIEDVVTTDEVKVNSSITLTLT